MAYHNWLKPQQKLGIVTMALVLAASAFAGAALGLVWQSAGFDSEDAEVLVADQDG